MKPIKHCKCWLMARWGDVAVLCPRLPVFVLKFVERVHLIFVSQHAEAVEVINGLFALSWILPLAVNAHYMEASPYLRPFAERFSRETILLWFITLFVFWGFCLAFCSPPSALLPEGTKYARVWAGLRRFGLLVAVFVWLITAGIFTLNGLTAGTVLYAGGALWNAGVLLIMGWNTLLEKERQWAKDDEARAAQEKVKSETREIVAAVQEVQIARRAIAKSAGR